MGVIITQLYHNVIILLNLLVNVPDESKRHPLKSPPEPTKLFFVSVAPPSGGTYFWDESKPDSLRNGLFKAIEEATGEQFQNVDEFRDAGYFLVPAVKCPSEKNGKDHNNPIKKAKENCSKYLRDELEVSGAKRILALGKVPMTAISIALGLETIPKNVADYHQKLWPSNISGRSVLVAGTYFAGAYRHNGFGKVVETIKWFIEQNP